MARFFDSSENIVMVGSKVFLDENNLSLEWIDSSLAPSVTTKAPSVVETSSTDPRPWEALRDPSSTPESPRFIIAAERRWVQFWRNLGHIPDFPANRPTSEPSKFVAYVGLEADNSNAFDVPESFLKQLRGHGLEGSISMNSGLSTLQSNIASGADAVLIFTHGHPEHGLLECRSDAFGLQPSELKAAFLTSCDRGHPLRFLYVMACQQRAGFLELLSELAQENALHPDFAGILMWGEPGKLMELTFRQAFFQALLEERLPFLLAVHAGRRALASSGQDRLQESAWKPIAVACHPQPNPMPSPDEFAFESYWAALRHLTINSLT